MRRPGLHHSLPGRRFPSGGHRRSADPYSPPEPGGVDEETVANLSRRPQDVLEASGALLESLRNQGHSELCDRKSAGAKPANSLPERDHVVLTSVRAIPAKSAVSRPGDLRARASDAGLDCSTAHGEDEFAQAEIL